MVTRATNIIININIKVNTKIHLESRDDGDQGDQHDADVHAGSQSSCIVSDWKCVMLRKTMILCLLSSPWTCNNCQTSPLGDPTCNRTPCGFHHLSKPITKYL